MLNAVTYSEKAFAEEKTDNRRKYFRTRCGLRAEIAFPGHREIPDVRLKDVTREGIGLQSWEPIKPGQTILISIPEIDQRLKFSGTIVRCHQTPNGKFDLGIIVARESIDAYKPLYQDMWAVECYRKVVEDNQGRILSSNAALQEWRKRFGARKGVASSRVECA